MLRCIYEQAWEFLRTSMVPRFGKHLYGYSYGPDDTKYSLYRSASMFALRSPVHHGDFAHELWGFLNLPNFNLQSPAPPSPADSCFQVAALRVPSSCLPSSCQREADIRLKAWYEQRNNLSGDAYEHLPA